ncbi:hypothetical protein AB0M95_39295 [Sphaerisporangium sp. NPDC051017]|uniref:hypothetical protein n=1 Tax=Sphaerisporangium sp. NPDC051017 TaxID=3154636 RepID=UPI0034349E0C
MHSTSRHLTAGITLAWLPLVPRPRPPALPLEARVRQLRDLAAQLGHGDDRITSAAEVCNMAALIASDCSLPDLARALCWRQHEVFDQARPLPASAAKLAVQPLLNLPRQLIREGDGEGAYVMLETLYHAARDQTNAVIDGRSISLGDITCAEDGHKTICTLVWAALLADGARALALAGRWREAAERTAAHQGVGMRLLDGRQVTILALAQDEQTDQAAALVEQSTVTEPWERAVQSLLRVFCRRTAGAEAGRQVAAMLTAVLALLEQPDPSTTVFRTRVGMTALDLADLPGDPRLSQLRAELIAAAARDAYVARDALAHPLLRLAMTAGQHQDLVRLAQASGLGAGAIPAPLYRDLAAAVSSAENRLHALLDRNVPRS